VNVSELESKGWFKTSAGWCHPSRRREFGDRDEGGTAKPERSAANPLEQTAEDEARDSRKFIVRVASYRCRLLDEDNLVAKYHVDGCRYAGLLPSDAPGRAHIQVTQIKVGTREEEHTRIVITPL
jgi:hypothetical protein